MRHKSLIMNVAILLLVITAISTQSQTFALVGGKIIDVSNNGRSNSDINNAVVIINGDKIVEVGIKGSVTIPDKARIIDVGGKYIIPGLIDGYAALDNQSFANAYLYMGITSIVGCYGYRRHPLYVDADPCPNIYLYGDVGHNDISTDEMLKQIEEHAKNGVKFLNLMYALTPEQVKIAIKKAHELGMPAIGEFSKLSYEKALEFGIDAILHFGRYDVELAPPDMRKRIIEQPHGRAFREFRMWLSTIDPKSDVVQNFAKMLGDYSAVLIPTLALPGVDAPFFDNVWNEPVAKILNPEDIQNPVNQETGKHYDNPKQLEVVSKFINNVLKIEAEFYEAGAQYLAGSGNDINGTMPGISLHQELELLKRVGLSNREVIATSTSNFADFLGWKKIGEIKPGRRADIIILNENPLDDLKNLKNISLIMLRGKIIDREKLLEM